MGYIMLPHPAGEKRIDITLALVERMEDKENILQAAEKLVEKRMMTTEAVALLKAAYGGDPPPDDFILTHAPMAQLATLLAAIISPLMSLGVAPAGKPAGAGRQPPPPAAVLPGRDEVGARGAAPGAPRRAAGRIRGLCTA